MNKSGVLVVLALSFLVMTSFALAANNTTTTNASSIVNASITATATAALNGSKIDNAFSCLSTQVKPDCSGVNKIQDIALVILASPSGVTQKCYDKLLTLKKTDCFGDSTCNTKDTALAVLALNHLGQDTKIYEGWLKNHTRVAEDLIWYLEQDSVGKAGCKVSYNSGEYAFNVLDNKKIDSAAGNCLSLANSNYWFQIAPSCYNTKFTIVCDSSSGYIATLLYKQPTSSTLYVLSDTKTAQASQPIELTVKSLCFGEGACNYEASAWATIALDKTGNDITDYVPYLIAGEEANQKYLPAAFLQIIKDFSEYGTKLIQQQRLNSWEADNTAYNKFYDTGLALLALTNSNQQKVVDSKSWLLNIAQDPSGCWNNNNIRDTAMILWALEGRRATVTGAVSPLPGCGEAGFFCITTDNCPTEELLPNYYCSALGKKCCKNENLQSCEVLGGTKCASDKICGGNEVRSSDVAGCCLGECETQEIKSECESEGGYCKTSCSSTQEKASLDCESQGVCCKTIITTQKKGSSAWIWIIFILLVILAILAYVYRDKLKVWLYKVKSGFKEDKSGAKTSSSGFPPASGPYSSEKPVQQRMPQRPLPTQPMRPMPPQTGSSPMRR